MPKKTIASGRRFEDDLERLQEVVQKLESGVSIEEALLLYQEGVKISALLEQKLAQMERKVFEVKNLTSLEENGDKEMDIGLFE